jgi:predicted transcriptional regulator
MKNDTGSYVYHTIKDQMRRKDGVMEPGMSRSHNYRTRDEIITNILVAIQKHKDIGVTRLMFASGLTHTQLKKYLKELSKSGLITRDTSRGRMVTPSLTDHGNMRGGRRGDMYHISSKGLQYLQLAGEMKQRIGPDVL